MSSEVAASALPSDGERPRVESVVLDTAEREQGHLIVGKNGAYIRLSPGAHQLWRYVQDGLPFERIAEMCTAPGGATLAAAEVEAAYRKVAERIEKIEGTAPRPRGGFWGKLPFLPQPLVERFAQPLTLAFHPAVAAVLLLGIAAAGIALGMQPRAIEVDHFWPAFGLLLISLLAHELGHSSACARYGARPSEIGFTFYLIYPAFYSDVSAAWTLRRWQRVVVDLGGVYLQSVVGALYVLLFVITGWQPLHLAALLIAGNCLFSVNPILKLDGYWVIADALGIANLSSQPMRIFRHAVRKVLGKPAEPLPWSAAVTALLAMYSIASMVFWAWFMWVYFPVVLRHVWDLGGVLQALGGQILAAPPWPSWPMIRGALMSLYMAVFLGVFAVRLVRRAYRGMASWIAQRRRAAASTPSPRHA